MHEPGAQVLEVGYHDLLCLGVSGLVSRVDLITLQYIFHQRPATGHHELAVDHAEVDFMIDFGASFKQRCWIG